MSTELIEPKNELIQAALSVASHEFNNDPADPGWQSEYDDERFDKAAVVYAEIVSKKDRNSTLALALAAMYRHDAHFTAVLCDEFLDKSGALLGRVRNWDKER